MGFENMFSNGKLLSATAACTIYLGFRLSILQIKDENIEDQRKIASELVIFYSLRLLLQSKMLAFISDIISTIEDIILGIARFLVILLVFFVLTFSVSFWLLAQN
jgi:hypothetical protein